MDWYSQAVRNFWQNKYDSVLLYYENDIFKTTLWGTYFWTLTLYFGVGTLYTIVDLTRRPKWLYKYKLQNTEVTIKDVINSLKPVIINMAIVTLITIIPFAKLRLSFKNDTKEIPTLYHIVKDYAAFIIVREILVYYSHRWFHSPFIYKHIHKMHHDWHSPISITAVYAHPIEHIVFNLLPLAVCWFITRSHIFSIWLWIFHVVILGLHKHAGYELPYLPYSSYHDDHHYFVKQNFGLFGFMDRLHGTSNTYGQTVLTNGVYNKNRVL